MKTTRYIIHTFGDQSLTALAFVTEDFASNNASIIILPVNLLRSPTSDPIISLSDKISEKMPNKGTHEEMCSVVLRKVGIPKHHQLIFQKIAEPMTLDDMLNG